MNNTQGDTIAIGDARAILGVMFPQADAHVLTRNRALWLASQTAAYNARTEHVLNLISNGGTKNVRT